eukprot:COSAG04_NODE_3600_length_2678_cov_2.374564_2_plen_302_part_00
MAAETGSAHRLTDAQLQQFAQKGWVVQESVLSEDECALLIAATDREQARGLGKLRAGGNVELTDGAHLGRVEVDDLLHSAQEAEVFRAHTVDHPKLAPGLAQLVGGQPQRTDPAGPLGCRVFTTAPHPRRADAAFRSVLRDAAKMNWHRGIRPSWGTKPATEQGQKHLITNWCNSCIFLTDVSGADDGGTMVLSGSHLLDVQGTADGEPPPAADGLAIAGTVPSWPEALARHEQVRCRRGSVLHFTEALIHAGNAVLSDRTRYALFFEVTAPGLDRRIGWRPPHLPTPWTLDRPLRGVPSL